MSISNEVQSDLKKFGIVVANDKCMWSPQKSLEWLGITFDLQNFCISIPERRIKRALSAISAFCPRKSSASARQIAGICGQLISMKIVIGPLVQLKTRHLYEFVQTAPAWDCLCRLGAAQKTELRFWSVWVKKLNNRGLSICSKIEILDVPKLFLSTDASETGAGGILGTDRGFKIANTSWSVDEAANSSTWRELKAVEFALESFGPRLSNKYIKLHTDNQGTVAIINKGSPKQHLQVLAESIFCILSQFGLCNRAHLDSQKAK